MNSADVEKMLTWQSVLTDHQAFTYEALANLSGTQIVAYVVDMEDEIRKKQGWLDSRVSSIKRITIEKNHFFKYCFSILRSHQKNIHIFAAPFSDWRFIPCMLYASWLGIEFYIISEPYSPGSEGYLTEISPIIGRFKAFLRPQVYRLYGLLFKKSTAGIFTISRRAYLQFQAAGFSSSKLFPFGYFIPRLATKDIKSYKSIERPAGQQLAVIFVGSLIKIKGIDVVVSAGEALHDLGSKVTIDIYGPGDLDLIPSKVKNISYKGAIPFGDTQAVMVKYDLALFPSRYDGWGVVVNEAILAGIPVICSNEVGASALVDKFGCGMKFNSGDVSKLLDILREINQDRGRLKEMRKNIGIAGDSIEPQVAARYMLEIIRSPSSAKATVTPPWY